MRAIHIFKTHGIEVACLRRGRPSYRWVQGYSELFRAADGCLLESSPLRYREFWLQAKQEGRKLVMHASRSAACVALMAEAPAPTSPAGKQRSPASASP